jgi:hypothetical protein
MCLRTKHTGKEKKELMESLTFPLTAYKVVRKPYGDDIMSSGVYSETKGTKYGHDKNENRHKVQLCVDYNFLFFDGPKEYYTSGYHCFLNKQAAIDMHNSLYWKDELEIFEIVIKCKSHITTVGMEMVEDPRHPYDYNDVYSSKEIVLVTQQFTFAEKI